MVNVIFRADANSTIGMGHVMRCLSIADAFKDVGADITFVLADSNASYRVRDRGYNTVVLNSDYADMDSELFLWPQIDCDYLIVDSYNVTEKYLRALKKKVNETGGKLIYIDDVYAFPYPVDILINYNVYGNIDSYNRLYIDNRPGFITGLEYAPLRKVFRGLENKTQPTNIRHILISTGGSDELGVTLRIMKFLLEDNSGLKDKYVYHFLIGSMNTSKDEIKRMSMSVDNTIIHENVNDMKSLIQTTDLVVSAAGSTLYEVCACGVPLITYVVADNQIQGAEGFEQLGMAINVGDIRECNYIFELFNAIETINRDYKKRCEIGLKMQELVDGHGADRIVKKIINGRE